MEEIVKLIGNFGFPIVITVYLLYRFEQKIDKLETAIVELTTVLKR
ncbi:YvrJ family protein [Niallia sp. 03133]